MIAEPIRAARQSCGWSQRVLSTMVDITHTYLAQIEQGERRPSEALVKRLSAVLDLDSDRLLLEAGRVPADIMKILRTRPEAVEMIRALDREERPTA